MRPTKYARHTTDTKHRVIAAAREGRGWLAVADAHGVCRTTTSTWIHRDSDETQRQTSSRGGRPRLLDAQHLSFVKTLVASNCIATLEEIKCALEREFGVVVSRQTVARELDGLCYIIKSTHLQVDLMNTGINKAKRKQYLLALLEHQAVAKTIVHMDETNVNLWCSRGRGWSKKGSRAVKSAVASRGRNMHAIAAITKDGIVHWKHQFGSFKKDECQAFVRHVLDALLATHDLCSVVVVVDNAPCHAGVEAVTHESKYDGVTILRLGPYSPMLNPIEQVFSTFKSHVKSFLASHRTSIIATPPGITQVAHRSAFLVRAAETYFPSVATAALCSACASHTLRFHAAVLTVNDVAVGE